MYIRLYEWILIEGDEELVIFKSHEQFFKNTYYYCLLWGGGAVHQEMLITLEEYH